MKTILVSIRGEHMKDVSGNNGDNLYYIDGYIHLIKNEDNHLAYYLFRNYTLYINYIYIYAY